ncbi:DNA internalization-related competence protein ComEC/Rec2 [Photobacterium sp. ZSDE20]|uniref:DNA internalization-related competence protein ComEC/Rec2 n=1 Tax=Photobacterium pectinilyticum TaxID=2906793 RepID=A0ABT1MXS5_9GAMM|nr:DNA internalization-related competence protein ComEC/Rec2 [Photobacterium sp. ZSDE20]MCQ1057307.1 DNA internalization-related competence protein ComEC/Rec2 [Photobacterium sp. ZSDE20]MDD1821766.1 DNA internalization-related competence protein ComEC/Rec2 [Photobacterium sp. ZSDE20]
MNTSAAGVAIGLLSLHLWLALPTYHGFITALMIGSVVCFYSKWRLLIYIAIGACLANLAATSYLKNVQLTFIEPRNITIVGEVSSLLNRKKLDTLFDFVTSELRQPDFRLSKKLRLRLSWQNQTNMPVMKQGERWQLQVRLRPPHGRVNSAGYDRERQFVGKGIHGVGVVTGGVRLASGQHSLAGLRQMAFDRALEYTDELNHQGYLLALGFGFRGALEAQDWGLLRDSGLAHLMAISGLHIGLAIMLGWWGGGVLRNLFGDWPHAIWLPLWVGLTTGGVYAWLAGFTLPTQRALLMSSVVLLLLRFRVVWPSWQVLLLVFTVSLALDPLASYNAGFWLSFAAVAVIAMAHVGGVRFEESSEMKLHQRWLGKWRALLLLQLSLLVLMLPVQWLWFGGFSPWAPLVLAAIVFSSVEQLAMVCWQMANMTLSPVLWIAEWARGGWWVLADSAGRWVLAASAMSVLLWLLPLRRFAALLTVLSMVVMLWNQPAVIQGTQMAETDDKPTSHDPFVSIKNREPWQIDLLDVGHGLAVLISTQNRSVLYDTGNRWPEGSIAHSVIEPVLKQRGQTSLDGLILSHADSDHAAGADYLVEVFDPDWKRSSDFREGYQACVRGEKWQWYSLRFRVLWPPKQVARAANPHSCVVEVKQGVGGSMANDTSLLLTGDIDAISELLLARLEPNLSPDILLVPHHGSRSSSTVTWLDQMGWFDRMDPKYALVSVARFNPWGLPSSDVQQRYLDRGVNWLSTAELGQVSLHINGEEVDVVRYRQDRKAAWFRPATSQE